MVNFTQLNEIQILMFALILMRMISFIVTAAFFGTENISVFVKILFSILLTLIVFKTTATNEALIRLHEHENDLLLLTAREILVGTTLGFMTRLFFFAISMAGELVSLSLGLSQGQIFNPMMGSMGNSVEQFYVVIGTLIYLALNGHHILIHGLVESFSSIPIAELSFQVGSLAEVVLKAQSLFILGVKIAAPILISMMIVQVGVALLSRAVPQINVIVTSSSITSILGFIIVFVSLPLLVMQMTGLLDLTNIEFFKLIKAL